MIKSVFKLTLFALITISLRIAGQSTTSEFNVYFKDDLIGTVKAFSNIKGINVIKDIQTNTDAKILVTSIHVESEIYLLYKSGILSKGIAYRTASRGNEDVHANTTYNSNNSYTIVKDGKTSKLEVPEIKYCVGDLYFSEPKGIKQVFSNMYGKFLTIQPLANNTYKINLPDGKTSTYKYISGRLESIEVEMQLGKIISKRKK